MKTKYAISLCALSLFVTLSESLQAASLPQTLVTQELIERGKDSFQQRCSGCHGMTAEGNGPASAMLNPKPRNLVAGSFKFRSTPSGILPTTQDLLHTIDQGILGTSMPSFRDVAPQEKLAIVTYVRSLRPEFKESLAEQRSIPLPSAPKDIFGNKAGLLTGAKRGKTVFQTMCVSCHGESGKGDGPSAAELTDSENMPIKPANLTKRFIKSGKTAKDIFRAISTGLDGSPMPGFADSISEAQRWDLTAYIFYLRGKAAGIYTENDKL